MNMYGAGDVDVNWYIIMSMMIEVTAQNVTILLFSSQLS